MAKDKKDTAVAVAEDKKAVTVYDYGEDVETGFEGMTQDEFIIPFLNLLQKGSRVVDEDLGEYVEGAKAGMLMNSVSEELYSGEEGVLFVPVHRERAYIEWVPRDSGGGFVGRHQIDDPMVKLCIKEQEFGKYKTPDGNDLVDTRYLFGLIVSPDGDYQAALIAFARAQIKPFKRWMTQARSITAPNRQGRRVTLPLYSHTYRITTRAMAKDGFTWHIFSVNLSESADVANGITAQVASRLSPEDELYMAAKEARELVRSEAVKIAYESMSREDEATEDDGEDGTVF